MAAISCQSHFFTGVSDNFKVIFSKQGLNLLKIFSKTLNFSHSQSKQNLMIIINIPLVNVKDKNRPMFEEYPCIFKDFLFLNFFEFYKVRKIKYLNIFLENTSSLVLPC